jgi:hypothetical protein
MAILKLRPAQTVRAQRWLFVCAPNADTVGQAGAALATRTVPMDYATKFMSRLLIVAILLISTAPRFAQAQRPDFAKLRADAQKIVSIISGDKAKTQTFCQMEILGKQIDEAFRRKTRKKLPSWPRN